MMEYLPIGSIVLLNGTEKALMVYGRKQIHLESGKEFDYIGCLYPEGYINDELTIFFNNDQIANVVHEGFSDQSESAFVNEYLGHVENSEFK
ncbi:MAG: DUF4176 domain-containing protein [Clostridia bacterium]|nr:DUF4176 domain-containing protein [Clostridia bacterium]